MIKNIRKIKDMCAYVCIYTPYHVCVEKAKDKQQNLFAR